MQKHTQEPGPVSTPTWETLEAFARQKVQEFVQVSWHELVHDHACLLVGDRRSPRPSTRWSVERQDSRFMGVRLAGQYQRIVITSRLRPEQRRTYIGSIPCKKVLGG